MPADRCEPPEKARGERYHWLAHKTSAFPAEWNALDECWRISGKVYDPQEVARWGYRWLAVAKPPEGA